MRFAVENLGDLASDWVTFNEPNVYSVFGYLLGVFPPGIRKGSEAFGVMSALIEIHCEAYRLIHEIRSKQKFAGKTMVGAAMHIRVFDGITTVGRETAAFVDYFFHTLFMEGMTKGRLLYPLSKKDHKPKKGLYADFLGINYYTRNIVEFVFDPRNYFYRLIGDKDLSKSDIGWDIYPEGIYRVCKKYYEKYKLPIFITENGISDEADSRRPDYIADHLAFIAKAAREGIPVERYYHWSFLDNFEWLEGERGNFGLYRCDFRTQKRTPRKSAGLYAAICGKRELTRQMIEQFKQTREDFSNT
ncbi:Beta-glucosidase A [bioreactor metagenome]|uniref:Beta-glucosidase A n=1 Tax=bioreactor metagenome TaxID=1076179 RepID=A0A645DML9_9ZZZZ